MATILEEGAPLKWGVREEGGAWLLADEADGALARPWRSRPGTLDAFLPETEPATPVPLPVVVAGRRGRHAWVIGQDRVGNLWIDRHAWNSNSRNDLVRL